MERRNVRQVLTRVLIFCGLVGSLICPTQALAQAMPRLPSVMRLAGGVSCQFTYGPTFVLAGDRANYVCSDGYSYLVGYPYQADDGSVEVIETVAGSDACGTDQCVAGMRIAKAIDWSGSEDDNCGAHYCEWVVQPDHRITGADLRDQQP
jgi:hypothetical protein